MAVKQLTKSVKPSTVFCMLAAYHNQYQKNKLFEDLIDELKKKLEREDEKEKEQVKDMKYYEEGLETILDIKCSPRTPWERRIPIQQQRISRLQTDPAMRLVIREDDLRAVIEHDDKFCGGRGPASNGKLRHLYAQIWRLKAERNKYKSVVEKILLLSPSDSK